MILDVHAVFGGSFNPPHFGHLNCISNAAKELGLASVKLLLAPQPPHKTITGASLQQRMDMLNLACEDTPYCEADFSEIELPNPSYTVNTLRHLRHLHPNKSIIFFLGSDSLQNIHSWYEWESLLDYSHIVVLPRPNYDLPKESKSLKWINSVKQNNASILKESTNGALFFAETPLWDVSSTELRYAFEHFVEGNSEQKGKIMKFVPPKVVSYIAKHNLYKSTAKNS